MVRFGRYRSAVTSSAVLSVRVAGAFLQLSLVAVVALSYSPYEVGVTGVLWSVAIVARSAGALGLGTVGLKLQAPLWAAGHKASASSLALRDTRIVFFGWCAILTIVALCALVGGIAFGWPGWWLGTLATVAAASALHRLFMLQLQAMERPLVGQCMESVALPGLALIGASGAATLAPEYLVPSQVAAFVIVTTVLFVLSPCFRYQGRPSNEPVRWRTSLSVAGGSLVTSLTVRSPIFFLGMQSFAVAGVYDVAQRVNSGAELGTGAVTTVYMSKISVALRRAKDLQRFVVEAAFLSVPIPVCLLVLLFLLGQEGVESLLGPEYSGAWSASVLLVTSSVVNATTSAMSYVVILGERERAYLGVCIAQMLLVIGGALLSGADSAAQMAFWVLMGEIFRSTAMTVGFILHRRSLLGLVVEEVAQPQ